MQFKKVCGFETADFGWQCLIARRLVERGVRFIQCSHPGGTAREAYRVG
ncbi:MAG: hypothetical protein DMG06_26575 [Acidobacteria bacterium]|nr:MAG: hypothetical protein DMG06_26575 [Acidobacteriota bacterium]